MKSPIQKKSIRLPGDEPLAAEWANVMGRFFQNFGMIETMVMEFVAGMASGFKFKSVKKKYLSQKLTFIIEGLAEHTEAPPEETEEIIATLEEIRQLSFFRNMLSHGAMGLSDAGKDGNDASSIIGILNYRPDDTDQDAEIISLDELKGRLQESGDLAAKLLKQLNGITFTPMAD